MKILKILFHSPFFLLRMRKNDAFLVPSKVIKISTQKTDSGWFIESVTTEKVREKILLGRGEEGRSSVSRASGTRRHSGHSGTLSAHGQCISRPLKERFVIPTLMNFVEERTECRLHFFRLILM